MTDMRHTTQFSLSNVIYKRYIKIICIRYILKRYPLLALALGTTVVFIALKEHFSLYINQSHSLPYKAFLVIKNQQPIRNHYIAFNHPWFKGPLVKQVVGIEGDVIHKVNDNLWVNNQYIGSPLKKTKGGRPLSPLEHQGKIPRRHYFVAAFHTGSFDSRYEEVGLITSRRVLGRAIPLF